MHLAGRSAAAAREFVATLAQDFRALELSAADRAMLEYAARLTASPAGIGPTDLEQLRAVGFDDRAIHDICAITGYYAFVNRIADGLGVELEERFGKSEHGISNIEHQTSNGE